MNYQQLRAIMFLSIDSIDTFSRHVDQNAFYRHVEWETALSLPCFLIQLAQMRQLLGDPAFESGRGGLAPNSSRLLATR
jgi:hypothetical protein